MSVMVADSLACPACGAPVPFDVCFSVNGGRHAHLRAAVLDGTFQRVACPACTASFRLDPELTYLDAGRAQWVLARPAGQADQWAELETVALDVFAAAFGPGSPAAARQLGQRLNPRVVFGWPALREKLVVRDLGLEDTTLELTKLVLIRGLEGGPLADDVELRLVAGDAEALTFAWVRAADEALVETLRVPREVYDDVVADGEGWAALRAALEAGPFVDVDRLLVEPSVEPSAEEAPSDAAET